MFILAYNEKTGAFEELNELYEKDEKGNLIPVDMEELKKTLEENMED